MHLCLCLLDTSGYMLMYPGFEETAAASESKALSAAYRVQRTRHALTQRRRPTLKTGRQTKQVSTAPGKIRRRNELACITRRSTKLAYTLIILELRRTLRTYRDGGTSSYLISWSTLWMQAGPPLRFSQKEGHEVVIPSRARYRLCMVDPSASGDNMYFARPLYDLKEVW